MATTSTRLGFQQDNDWSHVRLQCHHGALARLHRECRRTSLSTIAPDASQAGIEAPVTLHRGQAVVRGSVQGYNSEADRVAPERALIEEGA